MAKIALITGITGQDGSYLAELLLSKGYAVHGIIRRSSSFNTARIDHIFQDPHIQGKRLTLHYGDVTDSSGLNRLLRRIKPREIYHLAAQSHVRVSFDTPEYTGDVSGLGCIRLLDAIRDAGIKTRFYQASSSEMFEAQASQCEKPFIRAARGGRLRILTTVNTAKLRDIRLQRSLSTTNLRAARETFVTRATPARSLPAVKTSSMAIWTPNAIGGMPRIM